MYYEIDEDGCYVLPIKFNRDKKPESSTVNDYDYKEYAIISKKYASRIIFVYPYVLDYPFVLITYRKPKDNKKLHEIASWCEENLKYDWMVGVSKAGFNDEMDATAFKLRWC